MSRDDERSTGAFVLKLIQEDDHSKFHYSFCSRKIADERAERHSPCEKKNNFRLNELVGLGTLHLHVHTVVSYKLAAPRIVFFFGQHLSAITDPPVTKIRLWASFGV